MSDKKELFSLSAIELAQKIKEGLYTSEYVVTSYYHRIQEVNPQINAIVELNPHAIDQAKELDKKLNFAQSKGETIQGRLYGVPITIKEHIGVKGFKTTLCCNEWKEVRAPDNSTLVQKLLDEGAVILGTTNMSELGLSIDTDNYVYGPCRNPYDLKRSSGGSSGGEGSIIGARCSPLGIGSDIGGSVRIPAAYNGIVSFRPSEGLVSLSGLGPLSFLNYGNLRLWINFGPMARNIDDLELALQIISGDDDIDSRTTGKYMGDSKKIDVKNLKVAFFPNGPKRAPKVSEEVLKAIEEPVHQLKTAGVSIEQIEAPDLLDEAFLISMKLFTTFYSFKKYQQHPVARPWFDIANPEKLNIKTIEDYTNIIIELDTFRSKMLRFMKEGHYDALMLPVVSTTAPLLGETNFEESRFTLPFNATGWPVVVVGAGVGSLSKLPVGVQIVGKVKRDDVALALGRIAHVPPPPPLISKL